MQLSYFECHLFYLLNQLFIPCIVAIGTKKINELYLYI